MFVQKCVQKLDKLVKNHRKFLCIVNFNFFLMRGTVVLWHVNWNFPVKLLRPAACRNLAIYSTNKLNCPSLISMY